MKKTNARRAFIKGSIGLSAAGILGITPSLAAPRRLIAESKHLFKLSLNVYSFNALLREGKIDLFDVLDFCAKYNFEAIDPTGYYFPDYPKVPSDDYIYRFKQRAFLLGLDISGTGVRNDFAQADAAKRAKDIELIKQWIAVAVKMGCPHVRIFTGRSKTTDHSREEVFAWIAEAIQECCHEAAKYGVMISLQNHNEFLQDADEVDRLFKMVDSPWLGLNQDIGSYRQKDPYAEIAQNIGHAITWQIKENVWINGEQTPTDFVRLFRIIKQANYRGYLPLETLGKGDPFEKVPRLLEQVKAAIVEVEKS